MDGLLALILVWLIVWIVVRVLRYIRKERYFASEGFQAHDSGPSSGSFMKSTVSKNNNVDVANTKTSAVISKPPAR
jgi:hypothetical protein